MSHLSQAEKELVQQSTDDNVSIGSENALLCIQRALLLLNTHLETFRRRCVIFFNYYFYLIYNMLKYYFEQNKTLLHFLTLNGKL